MSASAGSGLYNFTLSSIDGKPAPLAVLPALQTIAKRPTANYGFRGRNASEELKFAAFKRWYEVDPTGARTEVLAQIRADLPH